MKLNIIIYLQLFVLIIVSFNLISFSGKKKLELQQSITYCFEPEVCIFGSEESCENVLRQPLQKEIERLSLSIKLFDENSCLVLNCSEINTSLFLNGGNAFLSNIQTISENSKIIGPGKVTLVDKSISLFDAPFSDNITFLGNGEFIQEKSFILSECNLSFYDSNKIIWSGNNQSLEILSDAYLTVAQNSSITFSDMLIKINNLNSFVIVGSGDIFFKRIILQIGEDVFLVEDQNLTSFLLSDEYIERNLCREISRAKIISDFQLLEPIALSRENKLIFGGSQKEFLVDGSDLNIEFSHDTEKLLVLPNDCLVKFINCQFTKFNIKNILLGKGSSITFGDNTSIFLIDDLDIDFSGKYKCSGNVSLFGNGNILNLISSSALSIESESSLSIENTQLSINNSDAFYLSKESTISLSNCDLLIGCKDIVFSNGLLKTEGLVQVFNKSGACEETTSLNISEESSILISSGSCLTFNLGTSFSLEKSTSMSSVNMEDETSFIFLNNAKIDLAGKSLTLSAGNILIDEKSKIYSSLGHSDLFISEKCCIKISNKATCLLDNVSIINS